VGYFFLSYKTRHWDELKRVVWQDTPEKLQWVEVLLGLISWILLGTYLGVAEGYEPATLALFFVFQLLYIGKEPNAQHTETPANKNGRSHVLGS